MEKAALSVPEFCELYSIGLTTAYKEIGSRRLRALKIGARTIITRKAAAEWLESLEPVPDRVA